MNRLPLHFLNGHLFLESDDALWLLDTGAPASFGTPPHLSLVAERCRLGDDYLGLTAEQVSGFAGQECSGLLGADVLGRFDLVLDASGGTVALSTEDLTLEGVAVPLTVLMGIPILSARIAGQDHRMFFDTGAQVSYLQADSLGVFPSAGSLTDFYPGVGQFEVDTHGVEVEIGGITATLRTGMLPESLEALMMDGTSGIIGNEIVRNRVVGYFPRRHVLVLGDRPGP